MGLGILLMPEVRRQGLGVRVLEFAKQYAFAIRGFHRLWLQTLDDNIGMQKLALAAGFVHERDERQSWLVHGVFHDRKCYSILGTEYRLPAP